MSLLKICSPSPNTRVWIRVSKYGKFPAESVLKFVLHIQSIILQKKHITVLLCFYTVIQILGALLNFQIALKNSLAFLPFYRVEVASLC